MAVMRRFFCLDDEEPKTYMDVSWDTVEKTVIGIGAGVRQEILKFHRMSDPMCADEIRTIYQDLGYSDESIDRMFAETEATVRGRRQNNRQNPCT